MEMSSSTQPKDPGVRFGLVTCFCMPIGSTSCCFLLFWGRKSLNKHDLPMEYRKIGCTVCTCNLKQTDGKIPKSILSYPTKGEKRRPLGPEVALHSPSTAESRGFHPGFLSLKRRPVQNLAWNLKATSTIGPPERKQG